MKLIILATLLGICMAWPPLPPHSPKKKVETKEKSPVKKSPSPSRSRKGSKEEEDIKSPKKERSRSSSPKPKPRTKSQDQEPKDHDLEQKDKALQEKEPEKTPPKGPPPATPPPKGAKGGPGSREGSEQKGKTERDGPVKGKPKETQDLVAKEKEFKQKREKARAHLEKKITLEKKKPIENREEKYDASKDGKFDEWLAKSKAVEVGARKLYEEAKKKVDAISETESKQKYENILKKILKKVEEITNDIKDLEKTEEKDASDAIEKALGYFLGHFQTRAMIKSDVSELILEIAKEQEDGDQVLKTLEQFLVALERSPLA